MFQIHIILYAITKEIFKMNVHKLNYIFHRELTHGISYDVKVHLCSEWKEWEAISDNWEEITCPACWDKAPKEIKQKWQNSGDKKCK